MPSESNDDLLHKYLVVLTERLPQLTWTSHDSGRWTWASPRWAAYTGLDTDRSQDYLWLAAVHPDDRKNFLAAWGEADLSGVLDVEHRLLNPDHPGEARWFHTHAVPLPEIPGQEREWLGTCTDVHDAKLQERRVEALQDASRRQVSDVLTLIRSMTRRTIRDDALTEGTAAHLDSRLEAIARTQLMLSNRDARVEVAELVSDGLLAYAAQEGDRVLIAGPALFLRGFTAELLGLMLHELAMNAVEHGALSTPDGRIEVAWHVDGDLFRFEWVETGVPMPDPATRRKGFGTELIESTLKLGLGAMTALVFGPHGIRCAVALPMADQVTPVPESPAG